MTQYEGIRTASDIELHGAYRRMISQANAHETGSPVRKASARWLRAVCDEINRRYPSGPDDRFVPMWRDYGDEG